ncbi:hypothetical protein GmHk_20G056848 [Glycine max]|nr:hypothetical protein GmHk_20G056848 [Glycine max]
MVHIDKWSSFCLRKILSSDFVHCIIGQTTTSKELLTGFDDTPQSKSKSVARWIVVKVSPLNNASRSTECEYYLMHWMSTIILGIFKNNWEMIIYSNYARPLEPKRLKTFHIQWATYYLKVKNETISV